MDSPDDDKINITFYSRVRGKNTGVNYKSTVMLGVVGLIISPSRKRCCPKLTTKLVWSLPLAIRTGHAWPRRPYCGPTSNDSLLPE